MAGFTNEQQRMLDDRFNAEHTYVRGMMNFLVPMMKRLDDLAARGAALEALLIQKGIVTAEEIETAKGEVEAVIAIELAFSPELQQVEDEFHRQRQQAEDERNRRIKEG